MVSWTVDAENTKSSWPPLSGGAIGLERVFDRYEVVGTIHRGGMGEVVLAEASDRVGNKSRVVLKRLLPDLIADERYASMFVSEARVMARLRHPNIVRVLDFPIIEGAQCLAMEFIPGRSVHQILRRCRVRRIAMPPLIALSIARDVLVGLDYAHTMVLENGTPLELVHRDVTPANVLVSFEGDVKIADFGIAKSKLSCLSTTVGVVKGTTRYLSPEQVRGERVTPRSDLFSCACVLVEMLAGTPLFERGAVAPTLFAISTGQRPRISDLVPFAAPALIGALERALSVAPERRQRSAMELASDLGIAIVDLGGPLARRDIGAFLRALFPEADDGGSPLQRRVTGAEPLSADDFEVRLEEEPDRRAPVLAGVHERTGEQAAEGSRSAEIRARGRERDRTQASGAGDIENAAPAIAVAGVGGSERPAAEDASSAREAWGWPTPIIRAASATQPEALAQKRERRRPFFVRPIPFRGRGWLFLLGALSGAGGTWLLQARTGEERIEQHDSAPNPDEDLSRSIGAEGFTLRTATSPALMPPPALAPEPGLVAATSPAHAPPPVLAPEPGLVAATSPAHAPPPALAPEPGLGTDGLPAPAAPALLDLRRPRGARIVVDGTAVAKRAPLIGFPVSPGRHEILVTRGAWRRTLFVEVRASERIDLAKILLRRSGPAPR